ncbi:hypothetical protein PG993_006123 [Apiospora rasikravindrae]|uniref:Peptidase A2 domain-containing protein n=1 Tax=Apiospora rasikravindrae TaxID=990691 RepID=A0ABR1TAQ0_9PEZI
MPKAERPVRPQPVVETLVPRRRSRICSPTSEWADRMRSRLQDNSHSVLAQQANRYEAVTSHSTCHAAEVIDIAAQSADNQTASPALIDGSKEETKNAKPWETLVVGANLGENLSRIEYKDREILQQEFIANWHEKRQPDAVQHQHTVLAQLVEERAKMKNTRENTTPIDELRNERAIADRLDILRETLESSRCDDEMENIRAAIAGYESGQITCSDQFTLIYGGHIVDTCPSYDSFCVDRDERLDRYAQQYGPGWLWHEPPLAEQGSSSTGAAQVYAKKGFCLDQAWHRYAEFGLFPIFMKFVASDGKVRRKTAHTRRPVTRSMKRKHDSDDVQDESGEDGEVNDTPLRSCTFKVMLDTGATFPILLARDLARLGIDPETHTAQGAFTVSTVSGQEPMRFYELYVGMGASLSSETEPGSEFTNETGIPLEKGLMGGLCPVIVSGSTEDDEDENEEFPDRLWTERLSGIMPFKACYVSSVPTAGRIWMGQDRKDVLGSQRMPPYRRFSTHHRVDPGYPSSMLDVQDALGTPEDVVFYHRLTGEQKQDKGSFTDRDTQANSTTWSEVRDTKILHKEKFGPKQAKKTKQDGLSWRKTREV